MSSTNAPKGPPKRPTINDIARLAKVSKKTVSRVINNSPFVRGDTRERVQAVIREQGYAPDPQARGLSLGRSFLIGLVFDARDARGVTALQLGLLAGLRGTGFDLVVHAAYPDDRAFLDELGRFAERRSLQGVVLAPSLAGDPRIAARLGPNRPRAEAAAMDEAAGRRAAQALVSPPAGSLPPRNPASAGLTCISMPCATTAGE